MAFVIREIIFAIRKLSINTCFTNCTILSLCLRFFFPICLFNISVTISGQTWRNDLCSYVTIENDSIVGTFGLIFIRKLAGIGQ